ncbi:MAG: hypothetical protein MJ114_06275 [Acetatifactor sp.]|nr:hypothetical protein [Acetatifactor sp.]
MLNNKRLLFQDDGYEFELETPVFSVEPWHQYGSERLVSKDALDALCYFFKGQKIQAGLVRYVEYAAYPGFFGYKLKKTPINEIKEPEEVFSNFIRNYPKEFSFTVEQGQIPDLKNEVYDYRPRPDFTNPNGKVTKFYGRKDKCYVNVPVEYSMKKYTELKNLFDSHRDVIRKMIPQRDWETPSSGHYTFEIVSSGPRLDGYHSSKELELASFRDVGMEDLPNSLDYKIAFADALVEELCAEYYQSSRYEVRVSFTFLRFGHFAVSFSIDEIKKEKKPSLQKWQ